MSFDQAGRGLRVGEQELSTDLSTGFVDKVDFLSKEKSLVADRQLYKQGCDRDFQKPVVCNFRFQDLTVTAAEIGA